MYTDTFNLRNDTTAVNVGGYGHSEQEDSSLKQFGRWREMEKGGEFLE